MNIIQIGKCCLDCMTYIDTGDSTFLDYHYSMEAADEVLKDIKHGMNYLRIKENVISLHVDTENFDEFSKTNCVCCSTHLAGERYRLYGIKH